LTSEKGPREFAGQFPFYSFLAFSPDGRHVAGASDLGGPSLALTRAATGEEVRQFFGEGMGFTVARFSPDGRVLAAGTFEGTVRRWTVATGKELPPMKVHDDAVLALAFTADGRTLATASREDAAMRLWDAVTGKERGRLAGHNGPVYTLAFSPDGRRLAVGGEEQALLLWDLGRQAAGAEKTRTPEELWADLADADGGRAYQAIWTLAARPSDAVKLLQTRLTPVPPAPPAKIAALLADLDSKKFATRQTATAELEKLGGQAEPYLQQALTRELTLEARRRVEQLLERLLQRGPTPEELRPLRAVEALERIGTQAARAVLAELTRGADGASLTEHARAALARLAPPKPKTP
jgi:hypothetical protein